MAGLIRHPWLPQSDPANCQINTYGPKGYWVPTEAEIEFLCCRLRADKKNEQEVYEFLSVTCVHELFPHKKHIEETQLCDCPYWGNEFND